MMSPDLNVVLIVDDNPTNLAVLSQVLKGKGYKVRVAIDGESAVAQAHADPPDLILLDIQMPGIDGFETCKQLKASPMTSEIPVIFITAATTVDSKVKGLSLGAVDYVTKPFQHEEVLARVKVHLQLRYLTHKVQEQAIALRRANRELRRIANLDGLTQVANRRRFDEYLSQEWHRLAREKQHLSLILCDIDYFKDYNDFYGHQAGDSCLRKIAKTIDAVLSRPADFAARYGGEEFAVILPNTPPVGALQVAEEIRSNIKVLQLPHERSRIEAHITLSLGVSCLIPSSDSSIQELIAIADRALYAAKDNGRDQSYLAPIGNQAPVVPIDVSTLLAQDSRLCC
ncbi:response regulator [Lyngbya confervoides]|uniref:PleD family two-component system response regulator n=1 Tax=Lyngbya confervoides BDU141951 TaxID=1574623 RepID=A0ABD4T9E0_9CYAN|nr:PleD family two-component system response regulator [Lyngbya confervoides]MCM1984950.1 PleD family two-component system response regulator [Lyngbya confervoides BDU141951]